VSSGYEQSEHLSDAAARAVADFALCGVAIPEVHKRELRAHARNFHAPDPFASERCAALKSVPALAYVELWCPWSPPPARQGQLSLPLRRPG
jgi:hypothetical protein